jgi:hypothetical protein
MRDHGKYQKCRRYIEAQVNLSFWHLKEAPQETYK